MPLSLKLVTPPVVEPVTLALAKNQCRVDFSDDDDLILLYISAAREYAEKYTKRAFYQQTWQRTLDNFPIWCSENGTVNPANRANWPFYADVWDKLTIDLPKADCIAVQSITYVDLTGTQQTLPTTQYHTDITSRPARIVPAQGMSWPEALTYQPGSVTITWEAGSFGDGVATDRCPMAIKQAILLMVGHWYRNREAVSDYIMSQVPMGVNALLDPHRITVFNYR
jgi:uncharacterized phiE125 gp8 family phage protein